MQEKSIKKNQKIIFCSFSNFKTGSYGDAVNDRNLFNVIPSDYRKIALIPEFTKNNKITIKSLISFLEKYLKEVIQSNNIFITRGSKLAVLPILLKKIFKNIIILRLGCTPLMFVEKMAFSNELEYLPQNKILNKIYNFFETHIEKYALRHAHKIIVENNRAKKIVNIYGANLKKIHIIPYYIQDYFITGNNPTFDKNKENFKVGYTGRFKKHDILIPIVNTIAQLIDEGYHIQLYLIGDGPNRRLIEKLVELKNLNQYILFLGSKPHKEVSLLINEYHCLILPMLNKLCPSTVAIKILEGVMKGKIIITTDSGNNASLFLNYTNLILKNNSDKVIAQKIKMIIENYDYYKNIAEELRNYHKNFRSREIYQKKIEELLTELVK